MKRREALTFFSAMAGALLPDAARAQEAAQQGALVDVAAKYKLHGGGAADDDRRIQEALDREPVGSRLVFAPGLYCISRPLTMRRLHHIDATGAVFRGDFEDPQADLLRIRITDAGGYGDVRNLSLKGGVWYLRREGFAGRHAIEVNGEKGAHLPVLGMRIEAASMAGGAGQGLALYHEVGHSAIVANQIDAVLLSGTPDANKIVGNLISGALPGVTVDVLAGAFCTLIDHNTIVCRDGALDLINGSQVKFRDNQCEQPPSKNLAEPSAHVVIRGRDYPSYGVEICGNNFGAGPNIRASIHVQNAQHSLIDRNTFMRASAGIDIVESASARWTRIGSTNLARRGRTDANDVNRAIVVDSNGVGAFGVYCDAARLLLSPGWSGEALSFIKDESGVVRFTGRLTGAGAKTRIGVLPPGYRPAADVVAPVIAGRVIALRVAANGALSLDEDIGVGAAVELGGLSFVAAPCDDCAATP